MQSDPKYERKLQARALDRIRQATHANFETLTELREKVENGGDIQQDLKTLLTKHTGRELFPLRPQLTYLLDEVKQRCDVKPQLKMMVTEARDVYREWLPLRWAKNPAPRRVVVQNAARERQPGGTLPLLVIVAKRKRLSDEEKNEPRKRARVEPEQPAAFVTRDVTDLTGDDDDE